LRLEKSSLDPNAVLVMPCVGSVSHYRAGEERRVDEAVGMT